MYAETTENRLLHTWAAALPDEGRAVRLLPRHDWTPGQLRVAGLRLDPVVPLPPTATAAELAARLLAEDGGWIAIADDKKFLGVVTTRALLEALKRGRSDEPARNLLDRDPPRCAPESSVADAVQRMFERNLRRLPVLSNGSCVGALPLSAAAACDDPAVRDLFERALAAPALFARPFC